MSIKRLELCEGQDGRALMSELNRSVRKVIYVGLFLETPLQGKLQKEVKEQHVTLAFRPKEGFLKEELLGKLFPVTLIGYACSLDNEGYQVKIPKELESTQKVPLHITVSTSKYGSPVKTGYLPFWPIGSQTRIVKARYGYFDGKSIRYR